MGLLAVGSARAWLTLHAFAQPVHASDLGITPLGVQRLERRVCLLKNGRPKSGGRKRGREDFVHGVHLQGPWDRKAKNRWHSGLASSSIGRAISSNAGCKEAACHAALPRPLQRAGTITVVPPVRPVLPVAPVSPVAPV